MTNTVHSVERSALRTRDLRSRLPLLDRPTRSLNRLSPPRRFPVDIPFVYGPRCARVA